MFCPQTFGSAIEKDDHTLEHFAQEVCTECNRNLIRIGSSLYTLHSEETCIKNQHALHHHIDVKEEPSIGTDVSGEIETQPEYGVDVVNADEQISELAIVQESCNIEVDHFKIEPENIPDEHESSVKIERPFVALNDVELQEHCDDDTFPASDEVCLDNLSMEFDSVESPPMADDRGKSSSKREKCDDCGKTYYTGTLKRHKILKHNFCTVCTKTFADPAEFDLHKPYCAKAKKPHRNTHCSICNLTMKTRKTYMAHMRNIHNPLGKPHKCECCGAQFRDASGLKAHTCRQENDQQLRVIIDPKKHIMPDGSYVCDVCNVSLKSRNALKSHKIFIHKELGEMVCRRCAKAFQTAEEFSKHKIECELKKQNKNFGDFKTFECDICKAVLKSKEGVRLHIQHTHLKTEKRFKCEQCGSAFYTKSEVKAHNRRAHLNIRDFICTTCGKAFKLRYQLRTHEKFVHSGEKYKCSHDNCNKYFSTPTSRKKHMETHRETPVNPLEGRVNCDLCGLSFANKLTLQSHHRLIHLNIRNYKCMICDQGFKSKLALQLHTYKHTGEKPYACLHEGCDRKFRSQSNRDEHNRSHTGEKPFLCTIDGCEQRFRFRVDFRRHRINVHGVSSNKSFPCSVCGVVLSKNSLLVKHMKLHAAGS